MDDGLDNIGAAITGGLAARAVEPEAGEGRAGGHETECANCSVPLVGPHCHFCGQKAHVHRTLTAILHDLVHGVLHLDGKFWRTLPLLIWRPGELTRRYAHGERAKFVSPLGMFLFSVFLMFAIFSAAGLSLSNIDVENAAPLLNPEAALEGLDNSLAEARENRADLEERIAEAGSGAEREALEQQAAALDARIAHFEEGRVTLERLAEGDEAAAVEVERTLAELQGERGNGGFQLVGADIRTGWGRLDKGIEKLRENPSLALYKLQSNFYKFSWLLIPISVPFVWLLFFWTRRFRMYDHSVFVTYSLSFMSLLAIGLTILGLMRVHEAVIVLSALLIPPIHIFRQLKGAYRLHWVSALIRTILLTNFCFITATLFFTLLLGIGALG